MSSSRASTCPRSGSTCSTTCSASTATGADPAADIVAVSVLWFRSTDDFLNHYFASPEDAAAFQAEEGFLDLTKAFSFVMTSHPSAGPAAATGRTRVMTDGPRLPRDTELELVERVFVQHAARTTTLAPAGTRVPASRYVSLGQCERERTQLFRDRPCTRA